MPKLIFSETQDLIGKLSRLNPWVLHVGGQCYQVQGCIICTRGLQLAICRQEGELMALDSINAEQVADEFEVTRVHFYVLSWAGYASE